jgi:hypothetical protein
VVAIAAVLLALTPTGCRGVTDGTLCMPLPAGWSRVVSPGHVGGGSAAYLLAGNFRFHRRPNQKGWPKVPPHKVAIDVADFPVLGQSRHWRRVETLRLPSREKRIVRWHVRFAGRAVTVEVRFGSRPDARMRALVNRRLSAVRLL